jgi:glutamate-1-semialdehyde 2,1-aminomutase
MSLLSSVPTQCRTNEEAYARIRTLVAGGVSSNLRSRGMSLPLVVREAKGCRLRDVEDRELIDLNMGYGAHLFGYADSEVLSEVADQFGRGHLTGLPHERDADAAGLIAELVPSVQQMRFANSGTEAIASAVRLARAATRRSLVLTFAGHYHGWSETLLRSTGTPAGEPLRPGAPGMIPEALAHTVEVPFNDPRAVDAVFAARPDIAAVICEPVQVSERVTAPDPGFLEHLRVITRGHGAVLIFDEVVTGFRVARGGAQHRYGITPDLTVLSKVLGGGFPVAAFGGSREAMAPLARNEAFHAGVYAGNHAAIRAVAANLGKIRRSPGVYERLEEIGAYAERRITEAYAAAGTPVLTARVGSVMSVVTMRPTPAGPVPDPERHRQVQAQCQRAGVYFHPNPQEPWFLSTAHHESDLDACAAVFERALRGPA